MMHTKNVGSMPPQQNQQRDGLAIRRMVRALRPRSANQLHAWVRIVLQFDVPRSALEEENDAPFAYLEHAFFEQRSPRDCVVWANRGGGKTQLGAIATLLDMLFKPGIQIRILGGSFDQSSRMYQYLRELLDDDVLRDVLDGVPTGRRVRLVNGSQVEVLSQSERAVRGQRVHKLRCDEVELFEPDVWRAAQLITRSGWCGDVFVHGSIETLSTMHKPFGLMQRLVDGDQERGVDGDGDARSAADGHAQTGRRIFRWSVMDVLERCPAWRVCEGCALWQECGGRARQARGFMRIDDVIQQRGRVGMEVWESEMLCRRPNRSDAVYPQFSRQAHVQWFDGPGLGLGLGTGLAEQDAARWIGGIDFGYRAPTVLLWAFVDGADVLHIVDELVVRGLSSEQIIARAAERPWPRPSWIGADPAGHQRTEHLGRSVISQWRAAGYTIRTRGARIEAGIRAVNARLLAADGRVRLVIHSRCRSLVDALLTYRYPPDRAAEDGVHPVKDGADHAADALRYLVTNLDMGGGEVRVRLY